MIYLEKGKKCLIKKANLSKLFLLEVIEKETEERKK